MATDLSRDELSELFLIVGQFRARLAREQLLVHVLRGWIAGAVLVGALAFAAWLAEVPLGITAIAWLVVAPVLAALVVAVAGWPSRFDLLQVRDAVSHAHGAATRWPPPAPRQRRELTVAGLVSALALATLVLQVLPRPHFDVPNASNALDAEAGSEPRPVVAEQGEFPLDNVAPAQTSVDDTGDEQLAQRVEQAQTARQALDRLANALAQVSAGQAAAEAIQRGDYQAARDQLANLAEESDQLSTAAKQQLSQALQAAAAQTQATDRQLADRERQAAQALARGYYNEQRQSLRQLADQVQRSAQNGLSQGQLARDLGRLQQRQATGQQTRVSTDESSPTSGQGADQSPRTN